MNNRRSFIQRALGLGAGLFAARGIQAQDTPMTMPMGPPPLKEHAPLSAPHANHPEAAPLCRPVVTVDVGDLPFVMDDGVKVFHLIAEPVKQRITPEKTLDLWGYNGSAPGPTIQVNEGDRVRVIFDNHLPEATSMHWHGFEDRIGDDGMPGISQEPVKPGGRFLYEFDIHQTGTYFYHSHMAMQEMTGMLGGFIMHPRVPHKPAVDKDFLIHLQEYAVLPNSTVPNTLQMEFNWLLLNGRAGPATTPLIVRQGDRVRIRFVNLGMDHHPMHLHGNTFHVTGTEGGRIPETAWIPGNTVLVGVAQARDVEFVAKNPGDWMLHCHLPHHMMNEMSSNAGRMTRAAANAANAGIAPGSNAVPNFPQDAYMEGPGMAMDTMVERPENYGLRPGWSGYMMGMMNFVRVLPPDRYNEVIARMKSAGQTNDPYASLLAEGKA